MRLAHALAAGLCAVGACALASYGDPVLAGLAVLFVIVNAGFALVVGPEDMTDAF